MLQALPHFLIEEMDPIRESRQSAQGDGCGLLLTAASADGRCIMGAAGRGEKGKPAGASPAPGGEGGGGSTSLKDQQRGGCWSRSQGVGLAPAR